MAGDATRPGAGDVTDIAAPRRCARVLLVADDRSCEASVRAVRDAVDLTSARIEVVIMSRMSRGVLLFAPMSGLTTHACVRDEAGESARRTARTVVELLATAAVHRVAPGWAAITSLVAGGTHDVVVLGCRPRARARLRRVVDAAAEAGAALVVVAD